MHNDLTPAYGIIVSICLSVLFWIALGLLAYFFF